MQGITDSYHHQLKARISNLLNSYRSPVIPQMPQVYGAQVQGSSISAIPEMPAVSNGTTNMDVIESSFAANPVLHAPAQSNKNINVLDLQIANFALLFTLILLIGGTIYYWMSVSKKSVH